MELLWWLIACVVVAAAVGWTSHMAVKRLTGNASAARWVGWMAISVCAFVYTMFSIIFWIYLMSQPVPPDSSA